MSQSQSGVHSDSRLSDAGLAEPLLLTLEEAAQALHVPVSWLRKRVSEHTVSCTRLGRHIRFTRQQLLAVVESAEQPVVPAPFTGLTRRSRRSA